MRLATEALLFLLLVAAVPLAHGVAATNAPVALVVRTTADRNTGGGPLSLREAVMTANGLGGGLIYLPAGTYTLTIPGADEELGRTGDLDIWNGTVEIEGAGADHTIIEWAGPEGGDRLFHLPYRLPSRGYLPPSSLRLRGVTLRKGRAFRGGAVYGENGEINLERCRFAANQAVQGGAVYDGHVTAAQCSFEENRAEGGEALGGAIFGGGLLRECSFSGNRAAGAVAVGGAVYVDSFDSVMERCTLVGNFVTGASAGGGAVAYGSGRTLLMENCTLAQNSSSGPGGAVWVGHWNLRLSHCTITQNVAAFGAGLWDDGWDAVLRASVIAGNGTPEGRPADVGHSEYDLIKSEGFNLIGAGDNPLDWIPSDRVGVDPRLGPIGGYGGLTQVFPLLAGSPALDAGGADGPLMDQRGVPRPFPANGVADAGAYEASPVPVLSLPSATATYMSGEAAVSLDPGAEVRSDAGTVPPACRLSASFKEAGRPGDQLQLQAGTGEVALQGPDVYFHGVRVGNWSGGTSETTPLLVSFSSAAGLDAIQAVARAVSYANAGAVSAGLRTVTLELQNPGAATRADARVITLAPPADTQPPVAVDDAYAAPFSAPLKVESPGLLANDADPYPAMSCIAIIDPPRYGSVAASGNGSFVYRPFAGHTGPDEFTYWVTDGLSVSTPARVTLTVTETPPASTEGARVSGRGGAGRSPWVTKFDVRAAVRNGVVTGSVRVRPWLGARFTSTRLTALVVTGRTARLYGVGMDSKQELRFVLDIEDAPRGPGARDRVRFEREIYDHDATLQSLASGNFNLRLQPDRE